MILKIRLIALTLLLASTLPSYGQKVYKQGDAIVLDCGPDSGFPQEAIETLKGKKVIANPSNTVAGRDNLIINNINKSVYQKLEIAKEDLASGGIMWASAYISCQRQGEGWRLPTQRELLMIFIFQDAITDLSGVEFTNFSYWSATEIDNARVCVVYGGYGYVSSHSTGELKTEINLSVRCVREM